MTGATAAAAAAAAAQLAKIVLPGMKERRRGVIVNVGSGIATVTPSGPLLSVYTGTKVCCPAQRRAVLRCGLVDCGARLLGSA